MDDTELDSLAATTDPEPEVTPEQAGEQVAAEPSDVATPDPVAAAPEPAAPVEPEPEPAATPEPPRQVPLSVLMEEREARKQLKARLEEAERQLAARAKLEDEIARLREPAKPKPSFEDEPLVVLRDELGNIRKTVEEDRKAREEAEKAAAARAAQEVQIREFVGNLRSDEERFIKQAPDYYDALQFTRQKNAEMLSVWGYPEAQIRQMVEQSEMAQANAAVQRGLSPAEVAYSIARKMGYAGKAPVKTAEPKAPETKTPVEEIAEIKKKQAAAGISTNTPPKIEDLADASDSEIDAILKEMHGGR